MAENSGISWTDSTFNPWLGCTNVGPGCDHCYAEKLVTTRLGVGWGNDAERRRTRPANWSKVRSWNKNAAAFVDHHGRHQRVFTASLADVFDNKVDPAWRTDYWNLVAECDDLQFLVVTKRISNVERMLAADWSEKNYRHVVLIITVVNQEEAERDIPRLFALKAKHPWMKIGLSIEPMLGPIDLSPYLIGREVPCATCPRDADCECAWESRATLGLPALDWVITGGESHQLPGTRPLVDLEADWVRTIRDQCEFANVPHHFKQWGETIPISQVDGSWPHDIIAPPGANRVRFQEHRRGCIADGKPHDMGRLLDGEEHNGFVAQ